MKKKLFVKIVGVLALLTTVAVAMVVVAGLLVAKPLASELTAKLQAGSSTPAPPADPVVLFTIGMHVEPFGVKLSPLVGADAVEPRFHAGGSKNLDYADEAFFDRQLADIKTVIGIIEKHGGRVVFQLQTPFSTQLVKRAPDFLPDLQARGHEVALHFHESEHLGMGCEEKDPQLWASVLTEEIDIIKQAGGRNINYWSGGNLYPGLLQAAQLAHLSINSDYKNPRTQKSDPALLTIHPWRPAAGPSVNDLSGFVQNDPNGKIIYLPDGIFPDADIGGRSRAKGAGGDASLFARFTQGLEMSEAAATGDKVNVFHITIHPGEFRGQPGGSHPFGVIDDWLTQEVDPRVKDGRMRWATFSEMADAYKDVDSGGTGASPTDRATTQPKGAAQPTRATPAAGSSAAAGASAAAGRTSLSTDKPVMSYIINVHDIREPDLSAQTVLHLVDIFEKYGVHGDFYLTAPMVHLFAEQYPDVITRLKQSGQGISYHVRPSHPLYKDFDQRLQGLSSSALTSTLTDYETTRLDLSTGDLISGQPGGYSYVSQQLGVKPAVVGCPNGSRTICAAALAVYRGMGARMAVFHQGPPPDASQPFAMRNDLLVRPSDFSISEVGPKHSKWWNIAAGGGRGPLVALQHQLKSWTGSRQPFVTAEIHENNFYHQGPTPWTFSFFSDPNKKQALRAPFDLSARIAGRTRPDADLARIWAALEEMVAWSATNTQVATGADICDMAGVTG